MTGKIRHPDVIAQREKAHAAFDQLHLQGWITKDQAYAWLATTMHLPMAEAHIGRLSIEACSRVYDYAVSRLRRFADAAQNQIGEADRLIKRVHEAAAASTRPDEAIGVLRGLAGATEAYLQRRAQRKKQWDEVPGKGEDEHGDEAQSR